MGRGFKRDSKCRTNTHNLVWRHHSWWNCLFKTFKDEIRILSDVNVRFLRIKSETSLEFEWNWPQYKFQYTSYNIQCTSFLITLCLTSVIVDISFVTSLWSQISYQLLNETSTRCWCRRKGQHIFIFKLHPVAL